MEDYKANSHRVREDRTGTSGERKKVEKVVKGPVKVKKKNEVRKLTDVFISEDAANVKNYIFMDVLVPAIKKAVSDIVRDGIDMILYGESGRDRKRSSAGRVSYDKMSDSRYDDRHYDRTKTRTAYSCDEIVLTTRGEAEDILERMDELLDTYRVVRVADLYDLVGITGNYTDNDYGWTNLRNAEIVRVGDGYLLKLPRVYPIK